MTGCFKGEEKRYTAEFVQLFDTVTHVIAYMDSKEEFTQMAQEIYDDLQVYHQLYDIYNSYEGINNIKTINEQAGIAPVKVDEKIIDMLIFSKEIYEISQGNCNVAFGAVLGVWHNYRIDGIDNPQNATLPPMAELEEGKKFTDIDKVIIDRANSTVFLEEKEMSLDVGAIAKGYAVERVAEHLMEKGYNSLLLNVGGNVRTVGTKLSDGSQWTVGLESPFNSKEVIHNVKISNLSVVASGDYQRYYTVSGETYHHIIHPDTLMPEKEFKSVTVICEDSGFADGISTTLFNMSLEEGKNLVSTLEDTYVMWVFPNEERVYSDGFNDLISE